MKKDRRADAVFFGFDFQVNAAIVLMLENIKELKSLRLESANEDIDISLWFNVNTDREMFSFWQYITIMLIKCYYK